MNQSWITLTTNDNYALGALVLGQSLRNVGTKYSLHIMVTPQVSDGMKEKLADVFDQMCEVDVLDSKDTANLALIKRPDLGVTFTKLHCWRLTQYTKCVFLDADCLAIQNCDDLFDYPDFSAAPDIGWPDMFNSGVFVFAPSNETYIALLQCAVENGSFDGGDQGVLNMFFSNWNSLGPSHRLPFSYNMSSNAVYTYVAAYKRFAKDIKIVHFLGAIKPWQHNFDVRNGQLQFKTESMSHYEHVLQWWQVFTHFVMPNLQPEQLPYSCTIPLCCLQGTCAIHQVAPTDSYSQLQSSQPWAPPDIPSFFAAPSLFFMPSFTGDVSQKSSHIEVFPPALAVIAQTMPDVVGTEPEIVSVLAKTEEIIPGVWSTEDVINLFPSFKYQNRLTHCPICNMSLSFLDDYFPVAKSPDTAQKVKTSTISEEIPVSSHEHHHEEAPEHHQEEAPVINQDQDFYWDHQHQMAFESGAIDYLGRDSWENIQKYLDQHLG